MDASTGAAVTTVANPFAGLISIINQVCVWKLLDMNGEVGWHSLIPYLSSVAFGKICDRPEQGKKQGILSLVLIASAIVVMLTGISAQNSENMPIPLLISFIIMLVVLIWVIVLDVKMRNAYVDKVGAQSYWKLVWFLLPVAGFIYFAFVHKNYDIPGVTSKDNKE